MKLDNYSIDSYHCSSYILLLLYLKLKCFMVLLNPGVLFLLPEAKAASRLRVTKMILHK